MKTIFPLLNQLAFKKLFMSTLYCRIIPTYERMIDRRQEYPLRI